MHIAILTDNGNFDIINNTGVKEKTLKQIF